MASCYWFDPKTKVFHGPGTTHFDVRLPDDINEFFLDNMKLTDDIYTIRYRYNWVRLTYNQETQELSCCSTHNKDAHRCAIQFIKQGLGEVSSMFLDINNQCTLTRIEGIALDNYLKSGKIKLDQFQ
jgi:hypothetical protein